MTLEQRGDTLPVSRLHEHPNVGVALQESAEQAGHDLLSRGGDRRDAQLAALGIGRRGGRARGFLQQAECAARIAGEDQASWRQPDPASFRLQQLNRERSLQRSQGSGDGGLRDDQFLGGAADGPAVRHGEEGAQLIQCQRPCPLSRRGKSSASARVRSATYQDIGSGAPLIRIEVALRRRPRYRDGCLMRATAGRRGCRRRIPRSR